MKRTHSRQSRLTQKESKDLRLLARFTSVYCRHYHPDAQLQTLPEQQDLLGIDLAAYPLCDECAGLLSYAIERRLGCPLDPKPVCKHCPVHCYRPERRQQVREVMRFSGRHLLLRGRLDLLWHYFF